LRDGTVTVRPARNRRRKGGAGRVIGAILALLLVVAAIVAAVGWYQFLRSETSIAAGQPVALTIAKGSSTAAIAAALVEKGVVANSSMFRLQARQAKADGTLKAGEYELSTGMPYDIVIKKLQAGPTIKYFDVPIPEGFTARQIATRFAKRANLSEEKLLSLMLGGAEQFSGDHPYLKGAYGGSLEGFLFPATYRVREGTTETAVVEMMLKKFDQEIAQIDMTYAKSKNLTVTDVVIIASILERETNLAKEYPLVASVIYNRLKIRMKLQLDSTVFYGMKPGNNGVIHKSDLTDGKPHNTYSHAGLPAGPISNPGAKALEAAAAPAKTDYLYYVLTGKDGSQTFTNNYPDFLDAVKVYKKVFGKQ
jgi:UPF0755 protein